MAIERYIQLTIRRCLRDVGRKHMPIFRCRQRVQRVIITTVENSTKCFVLKEANTFLLPVSKQTKTTLAGQSF